MADGLLASIIAGNDPQAAQMLAASQGADLASAALNPNFGHNEGPFGALAKTIAGFSGGGQLRDAVNQIVAARNAARPELAQVMASDDPYKTIGANPTGYSQQTLASLLSGSPQEIEQARNLAAQGALARLNVTGFQGVQNGAASGNTASVGAPANRRLAPAAAMPSADFAAMGVTGRPPGAGSGDVSGILDMPPAAQSAAVAKLSPQDKAALWRLIQQSRGQKQTGGGNAVRPPT